MDGKSQRKGRSAKKKEGRQQSARSKEDGLQSIAGGGDSPARIPVTIPASPGYTTGPLQGSARVVKDHCADWHNHMQKWDSLNDKGFAIANKIINLILQSRETEEAEMATIKTMETESDVASQGIVGGSAMPDGLEELCNEFTEIHKAMIKLVDKMASITKHFKGICTLEMQKSSGSDVDNIPPLFKTWPVEYFYDSSVELLEMYSTELDVKRTIVQDIAHNKNRDILMTYISTWQHQPYIEDRATTLLESMLYETGHR